MHIYSERHDPSQTGVETGFIRLMKVVDWRYDVSGLELYGEQQLSILCQHYCHITAEPYMSLISVKMILCWLWRVSSNKEPLTNFGIYLRFNLKLKIPLKGALWSLFVNKQYLFTFSLTHWNTLCVSLWLNKHVECVSIFFNGVVNCDNGHILASPFISTYKY